MTKNDIVKIYRILSDRYPKYYKKMKQSEQIKYLKDLNILIGRFDVGLLDKALYNLFKKNYPNPPTMIQLLTYVSDALMGRAVEVFDLMHKNGFYKKNLTGTEEEIDHNEFLIWDEIAVEFLKGKLSDKHQKEFYDAVNEYEYLKDYKGLILFDDLLPIPPGCDPNKDYSFSPPTAHLNSHKY